MNLNESISVSIEGVWANKMRSALTMLGIIIGIASVIAVVTIAKSGEQYIMKKVESLGALTFNVDTKWGSKEVKSDNDITIEDAENLRQISPNIDQLVAVLQVSASIVGPKGTESASIKGTGAEYGDMMSDAKIVSGRFYSPADDKEMRSVTVLDKELAGKLFKNQNPIGQRVQINNHYLLVIGLAEHSSDSPKKGQIAYTPIRTTQQIFNDKKVGLEGTAVDKEGLSKAMEQAVQYLNRKHKHVDHYEARSMLHESESFKQITGTITLIFVVIAGISLVVGGIGVMNIMLVSVTERTREIGIRKALGAQRKDILFQFLIESLIVCLIGGAIGTVLGIGFALLVSSLANLPPLVSWDSVIIAFGFSSAIGIFFGIYPANKAARLDPIEALRYE